APYPGCGAPRAQPPTTTGPASGITAGMGVGAATKGMPQAYMVNKGQVLQFTQNLSLAGSIVQSDKPIGAWGGQQSFALEACCDDTAHQQIPPVRSLGSEYVLVKYRDRYDNHVESPPWELVGAVHRTTLT